MAGSYEFKPLTLNTFVNRKFVYPRFQRRTVWKDKQNFNLLFSVFKGYPLGVVIVSSEKAGDKTVDFLLDGRQRKTCLSQVFKNPENIYVWAKSYCKLKPTDDENEVARKFWLKHDEFFYQDSDSAQEDDSEEGGFDLVTDDDENEIKEVTEDSWGMQFLLECILTMHPKKPTYTGLTSPFMLGGISAENAPRRVREEFTKRQRGHDVLSHRMSGSKCAGLYRDVLKWHNNSNKSTITEDSVLEWLREQNMYENNANLEVDFNRNWHRFQRALNMVIRLDELLERNSIGMVEAKDYSDTDRQMIFQFINDAGTPLTDIQILSASPHWNKAVQDNNILDQSRKALYESMEIEPRSNAVRWDVAACAPDQVDLSAFIDGQDQTGSEDKKLKVGFKLLSLYSNGSVSKQGIQAVGMSEEFWNSPFDAYQAYNLILDKLKGTEYFRMLKSWKVNLAKMTSENASFFLLEAIRKRYDHYQKPKSGEKYYKWLNDSFALIDRVIFQSIIGQWKGSGDSLLARRLKNASDIEWTLVPREDWESLLETTNTQGELGGKPIDLKTSQKIALHCAMLNGKPNAAEANCEIDHIIPKSRLEASNSSFTNAPFNLVAIDDALNRDKRDKFPSDLEATNLSRLSTHTGIDSTKLKDINSTANLDLLRTERAAFYKSVLDRREKLSRSQDS